MDLLNSFTRVVPIHYTLPYSNTLHTDILNEYRICHLLYHRSKNQHRVAKWWSTFDTLHRHSRKLLNILQDIDEILKNRRLTSIHWNNNKHSYYKAKESPPRTKVSRNIRKNGKIIHRKIYLHNQFTDSQGIAKVEIKLNQFNKEVKYLRKLLPSAYWSFMGVIELGQFSNLGFVLIGVIAKLDSLLQKIDIPIQSPLQDTNTSPPDEGIPLTLDDLSKPDSTQNTQDGGVIQNTQNTQDRGSTQDTQNIIPTIQPEKKKKKKKSKKKSIMDDIFG